ncbi:MAG: ketose-bisphosphate aldolase [Alphaproteobacteria bacterium]|nr:ketose-bisphosphate aldolase [Alphaproteobacteria bacterium]
MLFEKYGLVNTKQIFANALARHYAVGAFNFYNMETLNAITAAATDCHSPVILAVSESALTYMGDDVLMGMIAGKKFKKTNNIVLHLDHGSSYQACVHAIKLGFSSVMIDASKLPFDENIKLTRRVVNYAHKYNVSVEAELGILSGIEDENTNSKFGFYTNPSDAEKFVSDTNVDSLAVAIGTSHGAYKRKNPNEKLRFDILKEIAKRMPNLPLVLHGASSIPTKLVNEINSYGGKMENALGISPAQLRHAVSMNICKINVDSDNRIAFTAAVRKMMTKAPSEFNPRKYLGAAQEAIYKNCINEIKNIMKSENKLK